MISSSSHLVNIINNNNNNNNNNAPLVRYSGPFLKWTREEHQRMDQRARKLVTMHKALYFRDDEDKIYEPRKRM